MTDSPLQSLAKLSHQLNLLRDTPMTPDNAEEILAICKAADETTNEVQAWAEALAATERMKGMK